ncbi:MAG: NeuD/PglB/VioB family sugar acetyltransferase [Cytophagales bacterium]
MKKPVIIFGSGTMAMHALDIFKSHDIVVYGFLDDDEERHGKLIDDISILGNTDDHGFLKLINKKAEAFIALEELEDREKAITMLTEDRKTMPMNAIHNSAIISESASLGYGNFIAAGVVIQAFAKIDQHIQIFANSSIGAMTKISNFAQIGQNVSIGDDVEIGEGVYVGANATIISGVKIGKNAKIGPGSVVIHNVEKEARLFGNPAQNWKKN